jgi:MerR family redox-sensitive transcriptional activator SoxR
MSGLSIGEVAMRAGIRPSALRYYEQVGLIAPPLRMNGRRQYDSSVFNRLSIIAHAKRAGFTIGETKTLLSGFGGDVTPSARWRTLTTRKTRQLDATIAKARRMKRLLKALEECQCRTLDECGHQLAARG